MTDGQIAEADTTTACQPPRQGFGPFTLPPGQTVVRRPEPGDTHRIANIGNAVFATMGLRLLMDYPARQIAAFGQCSPQGGS